MGTEGAMQNTLGSTCLGAGHRESRSEAKRHISGREVLNELESKGITVMAGSMQDWPRKPLKPIKAWRRLWA